MTATLAQRYVQHLAQLYGDSFELAVCARLGQAVLGFQRVPRKPQGDGGIDGFSHGGSRAYCCYGPEPQKGRATYERAIIKKFSADLRRIFELKAHRREFRHAPNLPMQKILPRNQRIEAVVLISNWLESNEVLGPLHTKAREYGRLSRCTYVTNDPALRIIGPVDLAHEYPVDESTFISLTSWTFVESVQRRAAESKQEPPSDLDNKMARLEAIRPDQKELVRTITAGLKENWRLALAFDQQLLETLPRHHRALDNARRNLKLQIAQKLLADSARPWQRLSGFTEISQDLLRQSLGDQYAADLLLHNVAEGEVARLIGECTIDWKANDG
jgi:hypothetical protein